MAKSKPSAAALAAEVAAGRAYEVMVPVPAVVTADGSILYPGTDGRVYLDHARMRLVAGVPVIGDTPPRGLRGLVDRIRRGAVSVLRLLDSPILASLVPAGTLARARAVATVATLPPEAQLAAVIETVGSERLGLVWDAVQSAQADGTVTAAEVAEIIRVARGGAR